MKKKIIYLIFSLLFISKIFSNSIDKDCDYLGLLFNDVAIDMSLSLEENKIPVSILLDEIKNNYKKQASQKIEKQYGIDKKTFAKCINDVYKKYSKTNGHISIKTETDFFVPFEHKFIYYSDIFFSKVGNNYITINDNKKIKKGMTYTGKNENLFQTIVNGEILYRFGVFSSTYIKESHISVNKKEFNVQVHGDLGSNNFNKKYDLKKIKNYYYFKIKDCSFNTTEEKYYITDCTNIFNELTATDNIIFDLRNNLGGIPRYFRIFTNKLLYNNKNDEEFNNYILYSKTDAKRINTKTIIDKYILQGDFKENITYFKNNINTKYLINKECTSIKEITPWFKGNIYILVNSLTASVAEEFILTLKDLFSSRVIIIGQNTFGSIDYSDIYRFSLPDSKIQLNLTTVDLTNTRLLCENNNWFGDTKGIYPDYWCIPDDTVTILKTLTREETVPDFIK